MQPKEISALAEKIARLIETEGRGNDLSALFASIEKINHRLDKLEQTSSNPQAAKLPSVSEEGWPQAGVVIPQSTHPSHDRFAIAEAIADAVFDAKSKEKVCTFEPNAKPCDHCSMCSSRGF